MKGSDIHTLKLRELRVFVVSSIFTPGSILVAAKPCLALCG